MLGNGTLGVNEIFESPQGEATYAGTPSVFVRFQYCPIGCPWCDTKYTWTHDPNDVVPISVVMAKAAESPAYADMTADEIADNAIRRTPRHVVLTGGEPAYYDLTGLTAKLLLAGKSVQIETSGTMAIRVAPMTWVTVSPKLNMPGGFVVRRESMMRADEVKFPVAIERNVREFEQLLAEMPPRPGVPIWLQPVWQAKHSREVCLSTVMSKHPDWRLSVQTHKVLGVR